ncbi:hypothetical protein GQX73_g7110 [Xylaria multiplex]|uniref:Uncharacterized protein n=1 Tax=Xylaria multiplex TaxID=323545 RepID=A0A7C8MNE3_9PEZI|nr:hypothetical protein GQX73_g7110 [Xylaria multiplex]
MLGEQKRRGSGYTVNADITTHESEILFRALSCLKGVSQKGEAIIDYNKLANCTGYGDTRSMRSTWRRIKKKLEKNASNEVLCNDIHQLPKNSEGENTESGNSKTHNVDSGEKDGTGARQFTAEIIDEDKLVELMRQGIFEAGNKQLFTNLEGSGGTQGSGNRNEGLANIAEESVQNSGSSAGTNSSNPPLFTKEEVGRSEDGLGACEIPDDFTGNNPFADEKPVYPNFFEDAMIFYGRQDKKSVANANQDESVCDGNDEKGKGKEM